MFLAVAQVSGAGGRSCNEDYLGFCASESFGCFALADGTGGHLGGALAARVVVTEVLKHFATAPGRGLERSGWSIEVARDALSEVRAMHPETPDMNTTLATLLLDAGAARAVWSHLGDSRIYLFRNGRARVLTHDHSLVQAMVDAGYDKGEVRGRSDRNALYASVGSEEIPVTAISESALSLLPGDAFLLCSDGFWDTVDEHAMEVCLSSAESPEAWLQAMVETLDCNPRCDQDNYSAIAIWVGDRIATTRQLNSLDLVDPSLQYRTA